MLKLARYLRRYLPFVLAGILLLCGQALLELNLPNMMSNIVNTGIQKSGITELAPRAIAPDMLDVLTVFMNEAGGAAAKAAYTPYAEAGEEARAAADKQFPGASEAGALLLVAEGEALAPIDADMGRAGYALVNFMQQMAAQQGGQAAPAVGESDAISAEFDLAALRPALQGMMQNMNALQPALDEAVQNAAETPAALTDSVAAVLNKAFYEDLGADTGAIQTAYILSTGIWMVFLSLFDMLCAVGAGFCFAKLGAGVARDVRRDVFAKVSGFTNAEMDSFSTSSLITRTTNDVTQVQMLYTMGMRMLVFAPIMGIGGVSMALAKSAGMSWVMAAGVGVLLLMIGVLFIFVMPRFKLMQKLIDRLNQVGRENLTGIMVVRAFGNQPFQQKRFDEANKNLTANSLFVGRAMVLLMPFMMLVMNGLTLVIIWLGAHQIADSAIQVGDMMAFMQYAMQVIMSFLFIAMVFVMVPRASVSAERINEVLRSESAVKDAAVPETLKSPVRGEIRFQNVSFRYAGADEDALHDVSFTARPGQTTAIIGSTGSGKTTLVSLIPRFYDVSGGSVSLDGVDVRKLSQKQLRENIGYVPQKALLFSGTVASNLRYGGEEATDAELAAAADIAQATEFIREMEKGFEAEVSQGGTSVSGGQRQRLSIARALVKKAPVLIFDDSFSALDFATDARLRAALKGVTQNAAVLIVAQRISTIMRAEQIIVLDEGRVAGIGAHAELMQSCPPYREIAESQLSGEELA